MLEFIIHSQSGVLIHSVKTFGIWKTNISPWNREGTQIQGGIIVSQVCKEKATITQEVRAVIVVQKMEEKAHEVKLQNGYFGTGNNNLNLHPFILDSSQGIKNDKYTDRNKMLFKPINHFEMFLEKKIPITTFVLIETVNKNRQLHWQVRTEHAALCEAHERLMFWCKAKKTQTPEQPKKPQSIKPHLYLL